MILECLGIIFDDSQFENLISELKKIIFLTFPKIEIFSANPSKMMTLRLQILNFLCCEILFRIILLLKYVVRSTLFHFGP